MNSEDKNNGERDFENGTANDSHDDDRNHHEAENDNCDDTQEESNLFRAKSKQTFSFVISTEEWNSEVEIKEDRRSDRYLGGKWTHIFLDRLQNTNQTCPLVFKGNRVKREKTRTTKAPFFRGKAVCMFPGCVKYKLIIKRTPAAGKQVKVKVRTIPPYTDVKHEKSTFKGRPISGAARASTTADLQTGTPSQVFYERLGDVSSKQYRAGNTTNIGSKAVLQKIASESLLAERLHKDVITELSMQKEIYDSLDDDKPDNTVKGCIQYLSIYPFSVHIYTVQQLEILAMVIKEGDSTLYFDATGKVVSKIPDQNKRVFYYPVLLKGRQKGDPPVPVAEMLSNSHNTTDVCNFFLRFLRNLHILKPNCGLPKRIEIDFSWAFLHGILMAANHEDLNTYLQRAWAVLHDEREWGANVVIHICAAHLLHNISHHVANKMKDKSARKYMKHVIGLMIDINRLNDLEQFYRNMSILLLSPSEHAHKDYALAKNVMDNSIMRNREVKADLLDTETKEEEKAADTHLDESCPPGKTRFFEHFDKISCTTKEEIAATASITDNFLYCPDLHAYITNTYMSIAPLWTGLLMEQDKTHDTNSAAEYWMKIVKKDILHDKQRLRPALFIRKLRAKMSMVE